MIQLQDPSTAEEAIRRAKEVRARLFPSQRVVISRPSVPVAADLPSPTDQSEEEPALAAQIAAYRATFRHLRTPARVIIARVAEKHGLKPQDLTGRSRKRDVMAARFAAVLAVRLVYPERGLTWLGAQFNRDHTTVLHALRRMGEAVDAEAQP